MTMQEQAVAAGQGGSGQVEASLRQEGKQRMAGNTLAFLRNFLRPSTKCRPMHCSALPIMRGLLFPRWQRNHRSRCR